MTTLRVALIDGPTYAPLYDVIPVFTAQTGIEVEIVARLPHAPLNALVQAEMDGDALPFDLISTHIKYAPSQAEALLPLDDLLTEEEHAAFLPAPLAQCRFRGELIQLPRHTDTRLLAYRRDWFDDPAMQADFAAKHGRPLDVPRTWDELADVAAFFTAPPNRRGFAFTGQPSGLFGAFYELLNSAGGGLFDGEGKPDLTSDAARWALGYLRDLHVTRRVTPAATLDWDFAEVTSAFMRGEVAMIGDWPGSFGLIGDPERSTVADRFDVALYPLGPAGLRRVYSGSHSFALTRSCRDVPAALALLRTLTGVDAQLIEGRRGAVPTRRDVTDILQREATSPGERHRRKLLAETIATSMISFPPLATYPLLEETVWPLLDAALRERRSVRDALALAQSRVASDPRMAL
ncbi:MAG: sugar ABC transporter substrate-binding protein [Thermomicrobiales bacterium]